MIFSLSSYLGESVLDAVEIDVKVRGYVIKRLLGVASVVGRCHVQGIVYGKTEARCHQS